MEKCIACKVNNCLAEIERHPSITSLRALESSWKKLATADGARIAMSIYACKEGHSDAGAFNRWIESTSQVLEHFRQHGIAIRTRMLI